MIYVLGFMIFSIFILGLFAFWKDRWRIRSIQNDFKREMKRHAGTKQGAARIYYFQEGDDDERD